MRTTINVNNELINALLERTKARTKTQAIEMAIIDYLGHKAVEDIIDLSGKIDIDPNWEREEALELDEYKNHS